MIVIFPEIGAGFKVLKLKVKQINFELFITTFCYAQIFLISISPTELHRKFKKFSIISEAKKLALIIVINYYIQLFTIVHADSLSEIYLLHHKTEQTLSNSSSCQRFDCLQVFTLSGQFDLQPCPYKFGL